MGSLRFIEIHKPEQTFPERNVQNVLTRAAGQAISTMQTQISIFIARPGLLELAREIDGVVRVAGTLIFCNLRIWA
jgi:hypothetical protein